VRRAALAAALATLSCGRREAAAPAAPDARAPATAPAASSTAPQGVPERGTPLQDLPADLPSYPGASVVSSSRAPGQGLSVAFQAKESPEKVFEFYRQKLAEQGWNVKGEMTSADQRMLIAGKGDRRASVLVSVGESGETEIMLTLTHEEG
jgi:hypothetical protein